MYGSYLNFSLKELALKAEKAVVALKNCTLCAQRCRVNRLAGETGVCGAGRRAVVSSYAPHFGEESALVGSGGSGTIFFTYCNLSCVFCQNYDISQLGMGDEVSPDELAAMMLVLQKRGCHNINLVSPSHFVPQFLEALVLAVKQGLKIPIVYNTGGYDAMETLDLLDGIVDIYMPDIKFADDALAQKYCGAANYFTLVKKVVQKMHQQVGDLIIDRSGVARRGLLVRHLVLPHNLAGSPQVFDFLARDINPNTFVNIMPQYYPAHEAKLHPKLNRRLKQLEYQQALNAARQAGLTNCMPC